MPLENGSSQEARDPDMDELDIARAVADGKLESPQRYENVTLFAMRITGTGTAYRKALDEYCYRPPEEYLTQHFLDRCNGLPVIWEHPKTGVLNSEEYADRVIGTIVCPFIRGDEVWGVAKIYDDAAATLIENKQLSTSPCVNFRDPTVNETTGMTDGDTLLIEGKPSLLDHLAVCELGVWDKGGPAAGIKSATTTEDNSMTTEAEKAAAEAEANKRADADPGQKLDKILTCLDSLTKRMDGYDTARKDADEAATKAKTDAARKDALCAKRDAGEKLSEGETAELKGFGEDPDKAVKVAADAGHEGEVKEENRQAAELEKLAHEEKSEGQKLAKEDAARKDAAAFKTRLDAMERSIPKSLSDADYAAMADAQARCDGVAQAFGDSASRPLQGESLPAYRRRLASKFQSHSKDWGKVNLNALPDAAFDIAERAIYADSIQAAMNPIDLPADTLRQIVRTDETGRRVTTFAGRPSAWMNQFKSPSRRVSAIGVRKGN